MAALYKNAILTYQNVKCRSGSFQPSTKESPEIQFVEYEGIVENVNTNEYVALSN